ncbi:MAG: MiaB/RimO family radical SAM methylthiotransferase, partial [bacterium]|nr:MiaB/RimO family radical SAM methylthiotransferase [bacterium]
FCRADFTGRTLKNVFIIPRKAYYQNGTVKIFKDNRAWIKISDGCNQWCSFCIIPTVRGRLRNRPAGEIIREINSLVENGYNEIVLTGVHLGHYKNRKVEPQVKNLANLCRMIMSETDLHRLRLSSIEPQTVRDELVQTYADSKDRICRHFHMPLQSGSSAVLKKMLRPYDQNTYIKRVSAVKEANPDTIVGADVIVGFPGETEEDFQKTMSVCDSGLLDYLHVFSYSDRPDTPASRLQGKVDPVEIKRRNTELSLVSHAIRARSHKRQVGQTLEVIAENRSREGLYYWGVADNYIKVKLTEIGSSTKEIVRVKVTKAHDGYVEGELVE